jgi:hypothetical protein
MWSIMADHIKFHYIRHYLPKLANYPSFHCC